MTSATPSARSAGTPATPPSWWPRWRSGSGPTRQCSRSWTRSSSGPSPTRRRPAGAPVERLPGPERSPVGSASEPDLEDWRAQSRTVESIGAWPAIHIAGLVTTRDGTPSELETEYVTPGFFETLGVPAARGRALRPADHERSGDESRDRAWLRGLATACTGATRVPRRSNGDPERPGVAGGRSHAPRLLVPELRNRRLGPPLRDPGVRHPAAEAGALPERGRPPGPGRHAGLGAAGNGRDRRPPGPGLSGRGPGPHGGLGATAPRPDRRGRAAGHAGHLRRRGARPPHRLRERGGTGPGTLGGPRARARRSCRPRGLTGRGGAPAPHRERRAVRGGRRSRTRARGMGHARHRRPRPRRHPPPWPGDAGLAGAGLRGRRLGGDRAPVGTPPRAPRLPGRPRGRPGRRRPRRVDGSAVQPATGRPPVRGGRARGLARGGSRPPGAELRRRPLRGPGLSGPWAPHARGPRGRRRLQGVPPAGAAGRARRARRAVRGHGPAPSPGSEHVRRRDPDVLDPRASARTGRPGAAGESPHGEPRLLPHHGDPAPRRAGLRPERMRPTCRRWSSSPGAQPGNTGGTSFPSVSRSASERSRPRSSEWWTTSGRRASRRTPGRPCTSRSTSAAVGA